MERLRTESACLDGKFVKDDASSQIFCRYVAEILHNFAIHPLEALVHGTGARVAPNSFAPSRDQEAL